jgi:hypothetical protein
MPLAGIQMRRLRDAIVASFSLADLDQLVRFDLEERLENITKAGPLTAVAFDLIVWADQCGRTTELLKAVRRARPQNAEIQAVTSALLALDAAGTNQETPSIIARDPAGIRLYSSRESVDAGEISLLAISETIAATLIVVYLALWRQSLFFIALTVLAAPSLLLRTEESQRRALKMFEYRFRRIVRVMFVRLDKFSDVADSWNEWLQWIGFTIVVIWMTKRSRRWILLPNWLQASLTKMDNDTGHRHSIGPATAMQCRFANA